MTANALELKITTKVSDSEQNNVINDKFEAVRTSITEKNCQIFTLPDSTSDQQLDLNNVDGLNFLMIRSDKAITVKIGGTEADRAIALTPTLTDNGETVRAMFVVTASDDTLVYLSNASGEDATIQVVIF